MFSKSSVLIPANIVSYVARSLYGCDSVPCRPAEPGGQVRESLRNGLCPGEVCNMWRAWWPLTSAGIPHWPVLSSLKKHFLTSPGVLKSDYLT